MLALLIKLRRYACHVITNQRSTHDSSDRPLGLGVGVAVRTSDGYTDLADLGTWQGSTKLDARAGVTYIGNEYLPRLSFCLP